MASFPEKKLDNSFGLVVFAFAETVVADTVTTRRAEAKD
jgi:hypothetical protein